MELERSPSLDVIDEVAAAENVDPATLEPPLYDEIDPDALDALVRSTSQIRDVTFTYSGYRVRVSAPGTVDVTSISSEDSPENAHLS